MEIFDYYFIIFTGCFAIFLTVILSLIKMKELFTTKKQSELENLVQFQELLFDMARLSFNITEVKGNKKKTNPY